MITLWVCSESDIFNGNLKHSAEKKNNAITSTTSSSDGNSSNVMNIWFSDDFKVNTSRHLPAQS